MNIYTETSFAKPPLGAQNHVAGKRQSAAADGGGGKDSVPRKLVRGQDVWLGKGEEQESGRRRRQISMLGERGPTAH